MIAVSSQDSDSIEVGSSNFVMTLLEGVEALSCSLNVIRSKWSTMTA